MNFKQLKDLGWKKMDIYLSPESIEMIKNTYNADEQINKIIEDGGLNNGNNKKQY